jgi:hypothetical protein
MTHRGDFDTSAIIYGKFTTYRPSTGAPYTLAGTPALSVYKDNSTTQSTTGVTLTADFDSVTGLNHFAIDTSADGTFYSAGSFFDIVITTGTVDSVSAVGSVVASFTLRKNSALKPTTAGRTALVQANGSFVMDGAGTLALSSQVDTLEGLFQGGTFSLGAGGTLTLGSTGATVINTGTVVVGTNNDKTGYSLTQTFPTNFSSLSITASGTVAANVGGTLTVNLNSTDTTRLQELYQVHGLASGSPLTVSATARAAASISQTISTAAGTTTVTRI